jgi:hypothetical protein
MKKGRPEKIIDLEKLKELMRYYPSLEEVCGIFDCSPDTISRLLSQEYGFTFREYRNKFSAPTKFALKKRAIEEAMSGNDKMLIHCLRTMSILDDREFSHEEPSRMSKEELVREAEMLLLENK